MDIKIKSKQEVTFSKELSFDIKVPNSWQSLSDSQLQYFFTQLSHDMPMEEILTLCLFKWADLRVLCKTNDGSYLVKRRREQKQETTLTIRQVQAATVSLDFLRQFAPLPVRISKIGRATAIEADFQDVPFSTFISADNYYQGFLHTKNEALLSHLATLLYPKVKSHHLTKPLLLNAFYWFSSLKHYFSRLFPHFLQPMSSSSEDLLGYAPPIGEVLRTAMNAQIRALTGGDITKEEAVLSMDTWRALTELDAKAKEVEDIKRQTK